MGTKYRIDVVNLAAEFRDFCLYQTDPDIGVPNVQSLAWLVDGGHPTTTIEFEWTIDYSFVWSEVSTLRPGVVFRASQCWPADPSDPTQNQIVLDYVQDAYTFRHGSAAGTPQAGSLYIRESPNVPLDDASVGIGMSGSGTFAVEAEPNSNLIFTPHPAYWITAGTYEKGEVLDITQVSNPARIEFLPGIYVMKAVFQDDNTWTITPTI